MVNTYLRKGLLISASALSALTLIAAAPLSASAQMQDEVLIEEDGEQMIETDVTDADVEMEADMMEDAEMSAESDMMEEDADMTADSVLIEEDGEQMIETNVTDADVEMESDAMMEDSTTTEYSDDADSAIYSGTSPRALW